MRYCKEHDRRVNFTDNTASSTCTLTGSFGTDYYDPTKSEWSSSAFFIYQIFDASNSVTAFTFTVTGLGATSGGINNFQVNFTQTDEFVARSYDLQIVLKAY